MAEKKSCLQDNHWLCTPHSWAVQKKLQKKRKNMFLKRHMADFGKLEENNSLV